MIGPIVDSSALFLGGIAGTLCSGIVPKRIKETLPLIFGVITLCMGMTLVARGFGLSRSGHGPYSRFLRG